jgi:hypothetical protein
VYSKVSTSALGPIQPPIQWVLGALFPGVKRPGREADLSPPFSAKVQGNCAFINTVELQRREESGQRYGEFLR